MTLYFRLNDFYFRTKRTQHTNPQLNKYSIVLLSNRTPLLETPTTANTYTHTHWYGGRVHAVKLHHRLKHIKVLPCTRSPPSIKRNYAIRPLLPDRQVSECLYSLHQPWLWSLADRDKERANGWVKPVSGWLFRMCPHMLQKIPSTHIHITIF